MFDLYRMNNVAVCAPAIKQMPATSATTYAVGDALVITSGKVAKATGATKPEYICAENASGKDVVSCYPVDSNTEYKTTVNTGSVAVGGKYTIHTDAAQITTTTTNGVAEVVNILADGVVVKF